VGLRGGIREEGIWPGEVAMGWGLGGGRSGAAVSPWKINSEGLRRGGEGG